ncbi:YlxR family protein [Oerskovia jenensis]|uniref:YlxR family protein n=1 Tax=Oerskovia jenensis TaxID=162169 RepID=UPI0019641272|nr:YlxR family protein [Oerskovia jenensis]
MSGRARLSLTGPRVRTPPHDPSGAHAPVRTCVGCRERDLRSVLLRFVVDQDDVPEPRLVVDVGRSLPGRGAWLHDARRCFELAERRRAFPRALRLAGPVDLAGARARLDRED